MRNLALGHLHACYMQIKFLLQHIKHCFYNYPLLVPELRFVSATQPNNVEISTLRHSQGLNPGILVQQTRILLLDQAVKSMNGTVIITAPLLCHLHYNAHLDKTSSYNILTAAYITKLINLCHPYF